MKYSELKPGQSFMCQGMGPYYKLSPNPVLDVVYGRLGTSEFIYHTGAPNYFLAMMFEDDEVEPLET